MAEFSCDECISSDGHKRQIKLVKMLKVHLYKSPQDQIWKKHQNVVLLSLSSSQRLDPYVCFSWNFQCDVIQHNRPFVMLFICVFVVTPRCVFTALFHMLKHQQSMWACDESVFRVSHVFMSQHSLSLTYIPLKSSKHTKCLIWLEKFYSNLVNGQLTLYTQSVYLHVFI